MVTPLALVLLLAQAPATPARPPAAGPTPSSAQTAEREFRTVTEEFQNAWNKHDAQALSALFNESGDMAGPDGRLSVGRDEIQKLFLHQHGTPGMKESNVSNRVAAVRLVRADVAVVDWDVVTSGMRAPDGTSAPPQAQRATMVMTREGGRWSIASGRPGRMRAASQEESGGAMGPGVR